MFGLFLYVTGAWSVALAFQSITVAAQAVAPVSALAAPASADQADWYRNYVAHSRQFRLPDGRTLALYCSGTGSPTVIMEAGLSENALTWWKVQGRIARMTRVCVYDRAGLGLSPVGPMPRDTRAEVADLEQLLGAAHVSPPYLLVGHSMGGYNMRLFASRHLEEVGGMVLVDPSVEDQVPILEKAVPATVEGNERSLRNAKACAAPDRSPDIVKDCVRQPPSSFPPDLVKTFIDAQGLGTSQTVYSEMRSFVDSDSQEVVAERRSFGALPLIVLTRGKLDDDLPPDQAATQARMLMQLHDDVARLSSIGSNRLIDGTGHYIQLDKPDAVVDAVSEVLAAARRRSRR